MGKTIARKIVDDHCVVRPDRDIHVLRLDAVFCHEIAQSPAIVDLQQRDHR